MLYLHYNLIDVIVCNIWNNYMMLEDLELLKDTIIKIT